MHLLFLSITVMLSVVSDELGSGSQGAFERLLHGNFDALSDCCGDFDYT